MTAQPDNLIAARSKHTLQMLAGALRLSVHVLRKDPDQLGSQLVGRLLGFAEADIQAVVRKGIVSKRIPWLQPRTPSLTPPGDRLQRTMVGHSSIITTLAITPDGERVISAARDGTLQIWHIPTGKALISLSSHNRAIQALAITPDGRYAVSGDRDGMMILWDLENRTHRRDLQGHSGKITAIAAHPFRDEVISCGIDGTLKIIDLQSGRERCSMAHPRRSGSLTTLAINRDGGFVIAATTQGHLEIWDLGMLKCTYDEQVVDYGSIHDISNSPDNRTVLFRHDRPTRALITRNNITQFDIRQRKTRALPISGNPQCSLFTPDGNHIIVGLQDGAVSIFDVRRREELVRLQAHSGAVSVLAISPDNRHFISGGFVHTLKIWNLNTSSRLLSSDTHTESITAIAVSVRSSHVTSAARDRSLKVWDTENGKQLQSSKRLLNTPTTVAITPDGNQVIAGSGKDLVIWNRTLNKITGGHGRVGRSHKVVITAAGQRAISGSRSYLNLWDLNKVEMCFSHRHLNDPASMMQDEDLLRGLLGSEALEADQGWLQARRLLHLALGNVVTPDNTFAVSGASLDGPLTLWRLTNGEVVGTLDGHSAPVKVVEIIPAGAQAVSADADGVIRIWDLKHQKELAIWQGHKESIQSLSISPDGYYLVSGSTDQTLRVWNLPSGNLIAIFTAEAEIRACAFSTDGNKLIAGDGLGRMHFLELACFPMGPAILTPYDVETNLRVRCPACLQTIEIAKPQLGGEIICPSLDCKTPLKINPFVTKQA